MSDKVKDRSRVNLNEAAYWCEKFRCSETQLRYAVKAVGPLPNKVSAYLADRR